jgi:hypothetical protein
MKEVRLFSRDGRCNGQEMLSSSASVDARHRNVCREDGRIACALSSRYLLQGTAPCLKVDRGFQRYPAYAYSPVCSYAESEFYEAVLLVLFGS